MRAVGVEELDHLPFVRHHIDPRLVTSAWAAGTAAVVVGGRRLADPGSTVVTGFGPASELESLLASVAVETPTG